MKIQSKRLYVSTLLCASAAAVALAQGQAKGPHSEPEEPEEVIERAEQFAEARTAPGIVLPGAYTAAFASLSSLMVTGSVWTEETTRPYNSDDPRYRDPDFSNSSGGAGLVAGRITGLTVGGGYIYAGGADGGVFRSSNNGAT